MTPERVEMLLALADAPGDRIACADALAEAVEEVVMLQARFEIHRKTAGDIRDAIGAKARALEDRVHSLELQRKWQKEAIQRVRALIEDWKNDDEHAGCAYALLAALVHDDSEKEDDRK